MRNFFKYLIVRPLLALLIIIVLFLVVFGVLSATQAGTGLWVRAAQYFLPSLQIEGVSGYLVDTVKAERLVWEQDNLQVVAEDVIFAATVSPLQVPPHVLIDELSAEKLHINVKPTEDITSSEPVIVPDIRLPIVLNVENARLDHLVIAQETVVISTLRNVNLTAHTKNKRLFLESLSGDLYDDQGDLKIQAQGEMDLLFPHAIQMQAKVQSEASLYGNGDLDLQMSGELQAYQLQAKGHWHYAPYPSYELNFQGKGSFEDIQIESLQLAGEEGDTLTADGHLRWMPQLVWDKLHLSGEQINPAFFAPNAKVEGNLQVALNSSGKLEAGQPTVSLTVTQLEGTLRDYPVQVTLDGRIDKGQITLNALNASVGDNRLQAQGSSATSGTEHVAIEWVLDAPKLDQLSPDLSGKLKGKGSLSAKLDGSQLAVDIENLQGQVLDYPVQAQGAVSLEDGLISTQDLQLAVGDNHIELNGSADETSGIDWVIVAPKLSQLHPALSGRLAGKGNAQGLLDGSRFAVSIDQLEGKILDYPIKAAGAVRMQDQKLSANNLQINIGDNRVELNGAANESEGIDWVLDAKQLSQLHPELSGNLNGKGNAKGLLDGSRFQVSIDALDGRLRGQAVKAQGMLGKQGENWFADNFELAFGNNKAVLNGDLSTSKGISWSIDSKDLAQIQPDLKGYLNGQGTVSGSLDSRHVKITLSTLEGRLQDYPLRASGTILLQDQIPEAQQLRVSVGDNTVLLDGRADEQQGINWRLDANNLAQLAPQLSGRLAGRGNVQGKLDGSRLAVRIDQLQGQVQEFPVEASGAISLRDTVLAANNLRVNVGDNRIRLDGIADERRGLDWNLDASNLAQLAPQLSGRLQGRGNAQGKLDGSRFSVRIDELHGQVQEFPINASGTLSLRNQIVAADNVRLSVGDNHIQLNGLADERHGLNWTLEANQLSQLAPQVSGRLQGNGSAQLRMDGSRIALNINQLQGQVQDFPVNVSGSARLHDQLLSADNLSLAVGNNRVVLKGSLDERQGLDWTLDARNLAQLAPNVPGQLQGQGHLAGLMDGSRIHLNIDNLQGRVQDFPIQASGQVSLRDKNILADNLLVNVGQNQLRIDGGGAGANLALNWRLTANNLTQLVPSIRGSAQGDGSLEGRIDGSLLNITINRLNGQLEGRPLQAAGSLSLRDGVLAVNNVQLIAGQNTLTADGRASEPFDMRWRINASHLEQVWPGLGGSLQGQGGVRGQLPLLAIEGSLQASQLVYQDLKIGRLDAQVAQRNGQYAIKAALNNLAQGENLVQSAQLDGQGTLENHTFSLSAVHELGHLDVQASGSFQNEQWRGVVQSLALRDTPAGNWRLSRQIAVNAAAQAISVSEACLVNEQSASVCSQFDWQPQRGVLASGHLQRVPLSMAKPFLPETIKFAGVVNGDFQFEQRGGRPFIQANVQLPDNSFSVTMDNRPEVLRYTNAAASLVLNDRVADVQASLDIVGRGQMRAAGRINLSPDNQQHRIEGTASIDMPDIAWLQAFSPRIDELQGQLLSDVRVSGLLSRPQVTGEARLQNAAVYLPETGVRLESISLIAQAVNAEQIAINGSLQAGSGTLTANGSLQLANLPDWRGSLRLQGDNLLLMNTLEVQLYASPDLNIKAAPEAIDITGKVFIPQGDINIQALPESAKVRSDDIVIIRNSDKPVERRAAVIVPDDGRPLDIRPNVIVRLGKKVKLNAFDLDARLDGRLRILRNRQDIMAEGVLNIVDGSYQSYGQDLKIERGRILFNGPLDNPGLDVRAVRVIDNEDITVGIALGGTVEQPESTLFSTPVQTQTDTLSYLLTGRALSNVTGGDSDVLMNAVTSLGVSGGETLAQNLGGKLGLDDVNLNAADGDYRSSELSLGKRLGPKLYLKYIIGLFDSMQKVAINYQINRRLELEFSSGIQQSVDLIYKIDTNLGPFGP